MKNFTNELRTYMDTHAEEFQSAGFNQLDILDAFFSGLVIKAFETGEEIEFPDGKHFLMCVQAAILEHGAFDQFLRQSLGREYTYVDIISEAVWSSLASTWLNRVRTMDIPEAGECQTYFVTVTEIKKVADEYHDKF